MSMNDPLGRYADPHPQRADAAPPEGRRRRLPTCAARVLDVLAEEGYIRGYARVEQKGGSAEFEIELKYYNGQPAIREIKRVSKPGRRVYSPVEDLPTVANGLGVAILSTPKGVMSDSKAREAERRRRDPLQHLLRLRPGSGRDATRFENDHVAHRQKAGPSPVRT